MPVAQRDSAFLNIPYDRGYEDRFLAYIAGLTAFGLYPRVTLELTGADRRLDRIFALISACRYSFHDLSLVRLDRRPAAHTSVQYAFRAWLSGRMAEGRTLWARLVRF